MCVCVIFNFGTSRTMFSQKGGVCNGFEFVNNTSSSTTCFKCCVSLDFRPSVMEFPTRHLVLCNRVYLSGCSQFKQVGTGSNQLDLVPVHMI